MAICSSSNNKHRSSNLDSNLIFLALPQNPSVTGRIDPTRTQLRPLLPLLGMTRSAIPIDSALYLRDPGDVKVPEFKGGADGQRGDFQEASEDRTRRLERIQVKRSLRLLGIPEDRPRPEQRIITVPTQAEARRPREANA
ncbi:hypothetical protein NDU88_009589 [Pleurodeles waltl]|uniref:Uncharacterized protein n=1 Tax=Pleurodeles waltl TaxID=8319 RepID=A0AAV7QS27_PLEWA|nr:hypothetical protein NDU88_009589 [Pleurodeles waltl]